MKSFAIIFITWAIISQVHGNLKDTNIHNGDCDGRGTVIYRELMNEGWATWGRNKEERTVCCPVPNTTIKCIEVLDMRNDGTNGAARISSGGAGQVCATMNFESQLYRGMDFDITVWSN